jgi:hypothetical protein
VRRAAPAAGWSAPSPNGSARLASEPDPAAIEAEILAMFGAPLLAAPNPEADVRFDDHASPWYTLCEVRSPDRPGLLHAITVDITSAGADIHSAGLETHEGTVVDRFELTDRNGRKLDDAAKTAISTAVRDGLTPRRRLLARRR